VVSSRTAVPLLVITLVVTVLLSGCGGPPTGTAWSSASPDASSTGTGSADPPPSDSAAASPTANPSPSPTRVPAPTPPKPTPPPGNLTTAQAVLNQVNAWRTAAGLRPYTMSPGLVASAHKHNLVMIAGCGLSHRCPGEPDLGPRISAQGVHWTTLGENIGESGPNPNTASAITKAATGLDKAMFDEKPPNDGHRRNLLSKSFTHIGIDVIRDSKGTVWLTQDFSN
jgi:uncharacterized protein YkwD